MFLDYQRLAKTMATNRRVTLEARVARLVDPRKVVEAFATELTTSGAHVTILHIGKLADLASEIEEQVGEYAAKDFVPSFADFLADLDGHRAAGVVDAVAIEDLAVGNGGVRVLRLQPSSQLQAFRDQARGGLLGLLARLGIRSPEEFAAASPAIDQHSPTWLPHVTLFPVSAVSERREIDSGVQLDLSGAELRC